MTTVAARAVLVAMFVWSLSPALAETRSDGFRENRHYVALPVPTAAGEGPVLVQELFSYACIHCHAFEADLVDWTAELPGDVRFERVPAVFSRAWLLLAEAYYVAEVCGVLGHTHEALFAAIHEQGRRFPDRDAIAAFYAETVATRRGGRCRSPEDFLAAFESLEVASRVQHALALGRVWQAGGVPTLVVAGTWRTEGRLAGSNAAMLDVADHLIRRVRAEAVAGVGNSDR